MTSALLLIALSLPAIDPVARITGPLACDLGEQVMLDASGSTGMSFTWFAVGPAKDPQVIPIENGRKAFFAVPPSWPAGRYTFFLVVAGPGKVAIGRHVMAVGSSPNPGPPNPGPPGPSRFGLQQPIFEKVSALAPAARAKTPAVARVLRETADRIDSITPVEVDRLFANAAGEQLSVWAPIKSWLISQLKLLNLQGKIRSREDMKAAYLEAAAGLDQVKLWGDPPPETNARESGESRIASSERP